MTSLPLYAFLKARVDCDSLVRDVRLFQMMLPLYIGALASFFVVDYDTFSSVAVPHLVTLFVWSIYRSSSARLCIRSLGASFFFL